MILHVYIFVDPSSFAKKTKKTFQVTLTASFTGPVLGHGPRGFTNKASHQCLSLLNLPTLNDLYVLLLILTSFPTISCLRLCPNWLKGWNLCNSGSSPVVCPYNHLKQRCESKLMLLTMKHPTGLVSQRGTGHVWFTTLTSHQRVVPSNDRFHRHHKRNNTYMGVTRHHKTGVELLIAIGISIFDSFGVVWKTPDDSMISPSCARAHWLGQQGHLLVLQITFAGGR